MTKAVAEVRKDAKKYVNVDKGTIKKFLKSKTFTAKRGSKGIVGRIGVFDNVVIPNGNDGVEVAKYTAVQNFGTDKAGKDRSTTIPAQGFLEKALKSAEGRAVAKLISETQKKMDAFHASKGDKGKPK